MTVQSTWFGPEKAPLLGAVHLPPGGTARGGVVLCPPLGMEHINSYRGLALMAQQLCAAGLVVLRFDYPGTGDSAGEQIDPDAVEGWLGGVQTAADYLRSTGVSNIALVGLRAGALLAAAAAQRCAPLTAIVLWDPVVKGRTYVRQQSALYRMSVGAETSVVGAAEVVSTPALVLAKEAAVALSALSLSTVELQSVTQQTLVAARPDQQQDAVVREVVDATRASQLTIHDQDHFLGVSSQFVRIPGADIAAITEWLAGAFPGPHYPFRLPDWRTSAEVARTSDGRAVVETLCRVGKHGMFAIVTAAAGGEPTRSLVFYCASKEHRIGAGRVHVELARELAGSGVEVIRFDRRGTGETGEVHEDEMTPTYSAESAADAEDVLAVVSVAPADTTVVGMCSGSWMAMVAARHLRGGSAVLLSPVIWSIRTRERKMADAQRFIDANESPDRPTSLRQRLKHVLKHRSPYSFWRMLGYLGVTQVPEVALRPLLRRGVDVTVVLPPADHSWFVDQRGPEGRARLRKRNMDARFVTMDEGDHSLLHRGARQEASAVIGRVVLGQ